MGNDEIGCSNRGPVLLKYIVRQKEFSGNITESDTYRELLCIIIVTNKAGRHNLRAQLFWT
ncbi:hypothetical protein SBDP1_360018 [Syntrophobacter sp. SbD1]|nr:hypothetical protein SBDP1_360018 [Syntrophobacter sp. SbD1]